MSCFGCSIDDPKPLDAFLAFAQELHKLLETFNESYASLNLFILSVGAMQVICVHIIIQDFFFFNLVQV